MIVTERRLSEADAAIHLQASLSEHGPCDWCGDAPAYPRPQLRHLLCDRCTDEAEYRKAEG